jgi:Tfp pilus assembly protein PilV
MLNILFTNKGITLVESLIAMFLTGVAIVSLMPMQDMSLRTVSRADQMGRAAGIMQTVLEEREAFIMRASNAITTGTTTTTVRTTDVSNVEGDNSYTVTTTISQNGASTISWLVNVRIVWPGNANGLRSSLIVTRQTGFK